jgi:carboxymethylenebutenolidase
MTSFTAEEQRLIELQTANEEVVFERIYWDQGSVLAQIGLLDPSALPIAGIETARKVLDPSLPSNELVDRAARRG